MHCPNCHNENPPGARFCLECGHRLTSVQTTGSSQPGRDIYTQTQPHAQPHSHTHTQQTGSVRSASARAASRTGSGHSASAACCPHCHSRLDPSLDFCPQCGAPVFRPDHAGTVPVHPGRITQVTDISQEAGGCVICPGCGQDVDASQKNCPHCGAALYTDMLFTEQTGPSPFVSDGSRRCPGCGAVLRNDETHCSSCGFSFTVTSGTTGFGDWTDLNEPTDRRKNSRRNRTQFQTSSGSGHQDLYRTSFASSVGQQTCPHCHEVNASDAQYCTRCGKPLSSASGYQQAGSFSGKAQQARTSGSRGHLLAPILSAVVLAGSLFGGWFLMHKAYAPENTVRTYMTYLVNGDYQKAFAMLDPEETDFISADQFREVDAQMDLGNVDDFSVKKKSGSSGQTGQALQESAVYTVTLQEGGQDRQKDVTLVKTGKKHFLFFDEWAISDASLIARNVSVQVPEGASVSMNGITLDASLKQASDASGTDTYVIPELFQTAYELRMLKSGFEEVSAVVIVSENGQTIQLSEMGLSEENVRTLQQQAVTDVGRIYTAAMNGAPFTEVSGLFAESGSRTENEEAYDTLRRSLSGETVVSDLNLSNIQAFSDTSESGVNMTFDVQMEYALRSAGYSSPVRTSQSRKNTYLSYVSEDGQWRLASFPGLALSF